MNNKILRLVKKHFLLVWITVASVMICSMGAYALYESKYSSMNRVVVASSTEGMMFSSNLLEEGGESTFKGVYRSELADADKATGHYDVDVMIYNYNLSNSIKRYPDRIDYDIEVKLTDMMGNQLNAGAVGSKVIQILDENGSTLVTLNAANLSGTISGQTLTYSASSTSENKYTIRFPGTWNLDNDAEICVQMVAKPNNGGDPNKYTDLADIGHILGLRRSSNSESKGWQAYLKEQKAGMSVSDCDAYNLVVTGSGKASIEIKWNTTKVDFDKYFYNSDSSLFNYSEVAYTAASGESTWSTMVISANTGSSTTGNRNRYDVQLYKTGANDPGSWSFFLDISDGTVTSEQIAAAWVTVKVTVQSE